MLADLERYASLAPLHQPNNLSVEALRDGVMVRKGVVTAVKRGVEAGDLHERGETGQQQAHRREVVRLVKRRERDVAFEIGEDGCVDQHRAV